MKSNSPLGHVRIIAGEWRGRKLPVADAPGLRPSGDRVRETLFNWLQGKIHGARCADLFAGTGALGFEAASRGAREVTLVERSAALADFLHQSAKALKADQVHIVEGNALEWMSGQSSQSLDLVFLDPPFDTDLAVRALAILMETQCLVPGGLVYLECPRLNPIVAGSGLTQVREKVVGDVCMQLLKLPGEI